MTKARFYVVGFTVLIAFDTGVQIALKLAARETGAFVLQRSWFQSAIANPWIYAAIAGYIITFVTWMTLLERAPVGPAFVASHLQVVTVLAASVVLFHETLSAKQITGAICIAFGIVFVSFSATTPPAIPD